jgi:transcriptional regulator with XRE-family HTH domain
MTIINSAQCRAARGLLGISQDRLAEMSGVSKRAIASFEIGEHRLMRANMRAIVSALEAAGVEFIDGDRPGVRLIGAARPVRGDGSGDGPDVPPTVPPKTEAHAFA